MADTASWYGSSGDFTDPWVHKWTASGELFNENALTAASYRFKLGSMVKVTNLNNRQWVVVRINDKGPGRHLRAQGRVLDLSRKAFSRIADLKTGVIPIKEELL